MEMIEMLNQSTLMINGSRNILADFHPNKCMAAIAIDNEEFNNTDLIWQMKHEANNFPLKKQFGIAQNNLD